MKLPQELEEAIATATFLGQDTTHLRAAILAAIEAEREACAKVCDHVGRRGQVRTFNELSAAEARAAIECADKIRARGGKTP